MKLIFIKKIFIVCYLWGFFVSLAFSQNGEHVDGGHFIKRVEYNLIDIQLAKKAGHNFVMSGHQSHLGSKSDVEKLLFGDFNAPVEFIYSPSFEGATGFRIVKDSLGISILEIKYISNYEEVYWKKPERPTYYQLAELTDIPEHLIDSIPFEIRDILLTHFAEKQKEEKFKLLKVESHSFPISEQFSDKLSQKMVSFIDNFKAKGISPIIVDGYSVTFRTVVDDELWSLRIHIPQGDALKMSDLCRQIITDALNGKPDEQKYMSVLDTFENR